MEQVWSIAAAAAVLVAVTTYLEGLLSPVADKSPGCVTAGLVVSADVAHS